MVHVQPLSLLFFPIGLNDSLLLVGLCLSSITTSSKLIGGVGLAPTPFKDSFTFSLWGYLEALL